LLRLLLPLDDQV